MFREVERQLSRIEPGDHLCLLYETREEQLQAILPFVRMGLERGDRCVYIADEHSVEELQGLLEDESSRAREARASGQLQLLTKKDSYLRNGRFEPDAMLAFLEEEIQEAVEEGFPLARITGEMTWALGGEPGTERLIEYEARLNRLLPGTPSRVICQYNRSRFSPETIRDIIRTHPMIVVGHEVCPNPFYEPPEAVLGTADPAREVERMLAAVREHRDHKEALRRTRERFSALFEQSRDGVFITSLDGTLLEGNAALARILGVHPEELEEMDVSGVYRDPDRREELLAELREKGAVEDSEVTLVRSDGMEVECVVSAVPRHDQAGSMVGVQGILRDVTRRKRMEADLRRRGWELAERVKEKECLLQISRVLHALRDDGSSAALSRIPGLLAAGFQYPEITGVRIRVGSSEFTTPGFQTSEWGLSQEIPGPEDPFGAVEVCYLEERRELDRGPFLNEEVQLLESVAQRLGDALERREMAETLKAREAYYRTIIESGEDLVSIVGADGTIQYESPAVATILGYEPEELIGAGAFELVHPEDLARVRESFQARVDDPRNTVREVYRARHRDGSWRWLESVARNLLDDPAVGGIVVNTRDITERKELEDQLHLSQKMETVGRLAGGVAHDFNNLLTAIRGHCDLLEMGLAEDDPAREDTREIASATERAARLTHQLLAFSRNQESEPRVLDLTVLTAEMEKMIQRLIGEDVVLETSFPDHPLWVRVDRSQMEQVILNLAVNAREAMPDGGSLEIETERDSSGKGAGEKAGDGGWALLRVRDSGVGMAPDVVEKIFDPFFSTKPEGTGLGLSTVYGIVEQSRGRLDVSSREGAGTTFELRFQLQDPPEG